jgi:hypothetical protein
MRNHSRIDTNPNAPIFADNIHFCLAWGFAFGFINTRTFRRLVVGHRNSIGSVQCYDGTRREKNLVP